LVNGVDIIKWNEAGRIVEFKVMLRPLKAINLIHQRMAAMLHAQQ
ncbi:MAG TPA: nuclear transport factor 2 family protein, partial [Pseudomonadota bacterium]|nr:nuclear transport factor 2 family protein [Pseudomonadota bacterium]